MTRSRLVIALAAVATVAGLTVQEYFARRWGDRGPVGFDTMLFAQAIGATLWIALTPTVIAPLTRRFSLDADRRSRSLAVHAAAALILSAVHMLGVAILFSSYYFGWSPAAIRDVFRDRMHTGYAWSAFIYLLIVGALHLRRLRSLEIEEPAAPVDTPTSERFLRRILVKVDGRIGVVPVEQVDWLEAADNNVVVHAGSAKHTVRTTLSGLAERLDPGTFVRVHRSAVVNVERVKEVQPWFHGELVLLLEDATRLTIGRTYRDRFLAALEG
jgi:hypothetical protein